MWNKITRAWFHLRMMQHTKPALALSIMVLFVMLVALVAHRGPRLAQSHDGGISTLQWRDVSGEKRSITYIELPREPGRHDMIARDFFMPGNQSPAAPYEDADEAVEPIEIYAPKAKKNVLTNLSKELRLQAIIMGDHPMAFINDSILSVGQTLQADEDHVFEVIEIKDSAVYLKCESARIVLHLIMDRDGIEP